MLLKNLLWDYFGKFSSALMQLATSLVLTRLLSPDAFGLIGMTLAVNAVASSLSNFGFSSYIIQYPSEDKELQSSIFWFNLLLGVILTSVIIFISPNIAHYYKRTELNSIVKVCSLFIPISLALSIPNALLSKRLQFKEINLRNIIVALISAVLGIGAALYGYGVWALVIQQGLNLVLNLIVSYNIIKWVPSFSFNKLKFKGAFNFGKYIFFATLIESVYSRLDVFTIGKIYKMNSVGWFTRAQSLSSNVIYMSSKSILNVLFPVLTRMKDNREELTKNYYNFFHHICFIFCLLSTFCFIMAEPGFNTAFKPIWSYSALLFKIIILSSIVLPLSELMLSIIEARGNSKNYFIADLWKKVVLYPTYIVLFFYDIEVYLYANFFGLLLALGVNLFFLNKEINVGYKKSIKIFFTYFIPTLVLAFLLDKLFITNTSWTWAILKFTTVLAALLFTLKFSPSPTLQLILNKIKKTK